MTDTTETNEPIETVEPPEPRAYHLFQDEFGGHDDIQRMAETWSGDVETLKEALWYFRRSYQNIRDDHKSYGLQLAHMRARFDGFRTITDRDKTALREALEQIYGDVAKLDSDWYGWETYLHMAFYIGVMTGHAGEMHRLAWALKADGGFENAETVWDTVSRGLRGEDGRYPDPIPGEQAAGMAWREYRYGFSGSTVIHPSDPRLDDGWEKLFRLAKNEGLCEVFDTLAESFGVHKPELTRSGTVTVRFSGYVDLPVEGWDGDDIYEVIDTDDVAAAIRYDGHLEIDDVDISDTDWD